MEGHSNKPPTLEASITMERIGKAHVPGGQFVAGSIITTLAVEHVMSRENRGVYWHASERRAFLRWLGWGGGTACLAACGTASTPAGKGQKVIVTFWTPGGGGDFCTGLDVIARDFEQRYPSIAIAETQCGTGDQEFNEVLLARIAAGHPLDAALLWTSPAALAARGSLLPLDELMQQARYAQAENWPPAGLAGLRFAGAKDCLPVNGGRGCVGYNPG